jgi:CheY-like chemotaxis protein
LRHLLVVDDDPHWRKVLSEFLEVEAYEVTVASDGCDAMLAIQRELPYAIICDIRMPLVSGLRLIELLREQGAHIPVVLMTASASPPRHTAEALVRKSEGVESLLEALERVLISRVHWIGDPPADAQAASDAG